MKEGFNIIEELSLKADYQSLVDVENLIDRVSQSLGIHEDAYGNVLISVTEAVNNAICHGCSANPDLTIQVAVADSMNTYCFVVKDTGDGFDFNHLPDPTAPENLLKENGRGIFLMKNLSDEVEFNDKGNEVTIYFSK